MNINFWKILVLAASLIGLAGCDENIFVAEPTSDTTTTTTTTTTTPTTTTPTTTTTTPTTTTTTTTTTTPTGTAGSISYISASPETISIKGTGGIETSTVTFRVFDTSGTALAGQTVNFTLKTTTGGITISPASATSDANGDVKTAVTAGTVPTVASVSATLAADPSITTSSTGPIISTGLADQNSLTFAAEFFNVEGLDYAGKTVTLSVFAADHFNNPVPDGAVVYFQTEGGQIDPSCQLVGGSCTVQWRSANPVPSDGRVTVTATMDGEESFNDNNPSNGLLNDGENFTDLPEAFFDYNENGIYDPGVALMNSIGEVYYEEYRDFNSNGAYDNPDSQYNGLLCDPANQAIVCSSQKSLDARANLVLIMSGSFAINSSYSVAPLDASTGVASTTLTVADLNNQVMPYNTTVTITAKDGLTLLTDGTYTVKSSNASGGTAYPISVKVNDLSTSPSSSLVTVKITTPMGNTTDLVPLVVSW